MLTAAFTGFMKITIVRSIVFESVTFFVIIFNYV
jgi:hypothetical protein